MVFVEFITAFSKNNNSLGATAFPNVFVKSKITMLFVSFTYTLLWTHVVGMLIVIGWSQWLAWQKCYCLCSASSEQLVEGLSTYNWAHIVLTYISCLLYKSAANLIRKHFNQFAVLSPSQLYGLELLEASIWWTKE